MTTLFNKGLRPGLYAITDSLLLPGEQLVSGVEAAIQGGAVLVQYRDKTATEAERLQQARSLASLCQNYRIPLIINDDPALAARCKAAGVHLGQGDSGVPEARQRLGEEAIIGVTCHASLELATQAHEEGADYLAFGRFYASGTKPGAPSADPAVLSQARRLGRPVTAIGGITVENAEPIVRAGADLLAVVGGLFAGHSDTIRERARVFSRLFAEHHPLHPTLSHE